MSAEEQHHGTPDLPAWLVARQIDRRTFLRVGAATGLAFVVSACGGDEESTVGTGGGTTAAAADGTTAAQVEGATPAERAIAGLKALNLPADTTITVFSEDLTILAAETTKAKFEQESGLKLKIEKAPFLEYAGKVFNDATTKAGTFDVILMETNRLGDLDNAGYLTDLSEWAAKYNPELDDMIAPQSKVWSLYNGKTVGLPTDGDVFIFYYRKDLLESPEEATAFQAKYGRELAVPKTYDEYRDVLEFFTRPDEKLYGAVEWRVKGVTYFWFWQRLWSNGGTYFNDDMTPAINSEAGVKALEDMKAMNAFMPENVLSFGYPEAVEAMSNGTAFSNITWPAAGKNVSDPATSKTAGKWGFATVPGYEVDGEVNPKSMSAPGYSAIVSAHAKANKEAAYLYAQWLVSKENLMAANTNPKGNTDIIRASIFDDPALPAALFEGAEEYVKAQKDNLAQAVPDPIMPGYTEYSQALEIEISEFMTGNKSAKDALDAAASKWEEITDGFDREKQKEIWTAFQQAYGA